MFQTSGESGPTHGERRRVRVDLHNHTNYSKDGRLEPVALLELAAAAGVHALAVTDHDTIEGALECMSLARAHADLPRVIPGVEVTTSAGELVALYVEEDIPAGMDPTATAEHIRGVGGLVYLPHPFDAIRRSVIRPAARVPAARSADIIEVRNGRTLRRRFDAEALALAARLGRPMGAGSDAHYAGEVGRCYVLVDEVPTRDSLVPLLTKGRPVAGPAFADRLRAWRYFLGTVGRKTRLRVGGLRVGGLRGSSSD